MQMFCFMCEISTIMNTVMIEMNILFGHYISKNLASRFLSELNFSSKNK